ncbi:MAG TPA: acyl-CoA synthetase FdrA [Hyphomicrobiaceae bacterium]|nr:acyl-CoA synthetase FdrA [Hyphomicrobiaceae bacterium]
MPIKSVVKANLYKDSVALMRVSQLVIARTGVERATLLMGTKANKELLAQANILEAGVKDAQPSDIMIVVEGASMDSIAAALREVDALIEGEGTPRSVDGKAEDRPPRSIAMALGVAKNANLAQISVPGPYAAAEALKALHQGLNVFLFSDNVPLAQERVIKQLALKKDLVVMGPDCGTAIIRGVPLGFANVVRRGRIGLVGASGTGLQEVTCQIHRLGEGISHAIGTGSHDIHEDIGGTTTCQGLDMLAADAGTDVLVVVSKPPSATVRERVLSQLKSVGKPSVVCFIGDGAAEPPAGNRVRLVSTLQEAATAAVAAARGTGVVTEAILPDISGEARKLAAGQRFLRGLYSGGTFCAEAQVIWRRSGVAAYSNAPLDAQHRLPDGAPSREHTAIDLGSDEFTVGRPHPMIDPAMRIARLLQEAADPAVAAIVLDVVLGYGSHEDPAGALAPGIRQARDIAARAGRHLPVIAFVCGTEEDPQRLSAQEAKLRSEGVVLAPGSTAAAKLAAAVVGASAGKR